jgi:NTE family protein
MSRALVLSGGGTSGLAWQTGLLKGLRDNGVDLTNADLLVGTSAGAIMLAQLATGHDLDSLYAIQRRRSADVPPRNPMALMQAMADIKRRSKTPDRPGLDASELVELGAAALKATTESEEHRLATVSDYLPSAKEWPTGGCC